MTKSCIYSGARVGVCNAVRREYPPLKRSADNKQSKVFLSYLCVFRKYIFSRQNKMFRFLKY